MFITVIVVMVFWVYINVNFYQIVHFKYVQIIV